MSGLGTRVGLSLALVLVAMLAAPVAAQESPPPEASPSGAGPSPAVSLSPEASALAVEAQSIAADVFAQTAESPEEVIAAARAAEIERSGLAEIDPELPAVLAELEAQAAEEFATFLAEAPPIPEPSDEPSADGPPAPVADESPEASTEPSPEAGSAAFLAASGTRAA